LISLPERMHSFARVKITLFSIYNKIPTQLFKQLSSHSLINHETMYKFSLFLFLFLFEWSAAQHSMACGALSCQACDCEGITCPVMVNASSHVALFTNYSAVEIGYEVEGTTNGSNVDSVSIYFLSNPEYLKFASGQAFSILSASALNRIGSCGTRRIDSKGRGCVLVFQCVNPSRDCGLYYRFTLTEIITDQCNTSCATGSVQDGICDPECNNVACDWDGGDCLPPSPPPTTVPYVPPPPPSPPASVPAACQSTCLGRWLGNGICESPCNNADCNFDNGDCENPCDPNPCQNGGRCRVRDLSDFVCDCEEGWCGDLCAVAEVLNTNSLSDVFYCQSNYETCESDYSSFYFCCEYKTSGANYTCRQAAENADSRALNWMFSFFSLFL